MQINKLIGIAEHPPRADKSAVMGLEMLCCTQHDRVRLLSPLMAIPATPYNIRPYNI
jgi:hypothetical protein